MIAAFKAAIGALKAAVSAGSIRELTFSALSTIQLRPAVVGRGANASQAMASLTGSPE